MTKSALHPSLVQMLEMAIVLLVRAVDRIAVPVQNWKLA